MLNKLSLSEKLILGGFLAVFIPLLISSTITYLQLSNSLLEISKQNVIHISRDVAHSIDEFLANQIKLASSVAASPSVIDASNTGNFSVAQSKIENLHHRIGESYFSFFLADSNGIIRADATFKNQAGLNISDRGYFLRAKKGEANIAGPIISRGNLTSEEPILIVCAPIQDHGKFHGIAAIVFNCDFMVRIVTQHHIGRTGYAYLLNNEGIIIAHPKKEYILKLALLDQPGTEPIKGLLKRGLNGNTDYLFEGKKEIAGFSRLKQASWTAAFAQNRDEIMSPINKLTFSVYMHGVFFLIMTVIIMAVFFRKLSDPIQKMLEIRKQVTHHTTEIILQIGLDKKISFANPAFAKVTGLENESIIGTEPCLDTLNNTPPDEIWKIVEAGNSWSGRVTCKGNKPNHATLDVMVVPLRNELNTIHGYLFIGRDVSTELMYEKRLQQSQKLEAIGTLSGGIAHDFNNILSAIFGYAELASMRIDSVTDVRRYIEQIRIASERARDLVSQILTFSRKTDVELRPLKPKVVISESIKLLRASIPTTIDIHSNIDSDSMIMAEPTQLHQVIMNLFTNAAHAIGENSGLITLDLENFWVDDQFKKTHPNVKTGKHVKIRVTDTGTGIDAAILDYIFEPFFTTKSSNQGTGLGLSVVHGIVKKLNGIITVYSELGKGTAFDIFIPAIEPDRLEFKKNELVRQRRGFEKIVIIDDERSIGSTMQAILNDLGYQATVFTDSLEAIKAIEQNPKWVDILITDYSMPRLTGLEIVNTLQASGITIPTILTSGFLETTIEERARQLGITEFVLKPITSYRITDAIGRLMDNYPKDKPIIDDKG